MSDELPQGWAMPLLGEVVRIKQGNSKLTKKFYKPDGKYVAFSGSGPDGRVDEYEHEGKAIVLSAVGARCGKCFKADGQWTAIANTAVIRPHLADDAHYEYLFYLLNNEDFWPKGGTAQPFVQTGLAQRETTIPLPPLAEQRRIVAKLETLLGRLDACQQRLAKIPVLLKRFRQSVLAAACSGRLTADWREGNQIEDEWPTEPLSELFAMRNGKSLTVAKRKDGNIPVFGGNGLMGNHNAANAEGQVIVIGRVGAQCGNVHFISGKVWVTDNAISLEAKRKVEPAFYTYFLRSQNLNQLSAGTGQPYVSQEILGPIETPVVSLAEQQEIVRRVEALFALADQIAARFTKAQVQVDKLTPSLLAKAFRGELVPQNPADEPAEKLLERIQIKAAQ